METNVKSKPKKTIMQIRKAVERRRFAIQAAFSIITNGWIIGFIKGTIVNSTTAGKLSSLKYLCVPGMNCYSCPGALGSCPIGSIQAIFNTPGRIGIDKNGEVIQGIKYWFPFYVVGFVMLFGAICGRLICAFLCPFGLIQDLLYKIPLPKKLKIRTFPGDKPLRYLKYVILVVFVIMLPLLYDIEPFFCQYICPSGTLIAGIPLMTVGSITGQGITSWAEAGSITVLKLSILAVTIILSIMIYRPFCKYVCPLGAIYSFFNRISLYRFSVDESKCTDCGACRHACRMGVDITRTPNSPECIRCGDCKAACPQHAISSGFGKIKKTASTAGGASDPKSAA